VLAPGGPSLPPLGWAVSPHNPHPPRAQLANAEEYIDDQCTGQLGEVLIRCNNVLYIRGVEDGGGEGGGMES